MHKNVMAAGSNERPPMLARCPNEVNVIQSRKDAKILYPLALVAVLKLSKFTLPQSIKHYKNHAHSSRQITLTRSYATTRNKGKEIVKPPSPQSESASEEDSLYLKCVQKEWLHDTDEEPYEQELEAHYMYMAKIQDVLHAADDTSGPTNDAEPL
ncbi:hypothetical protein Tco_1166269 [Tanacetum coccineum]